MLPQIIEHMSHSCCHFYGSLPFYVFTLCYDFTSFTFSPILLRTRFILRVFKMFSSTAETHEHLHTNCIAIKSWWSAFLLTLKVNRTSEIATLFGAHVVFSDVWVSEEALLRADVHERKQRRKEMKRLKQGKSCCISSGNFTSLLLLSACRAAKVCMWGWLFLCLPSETAAGAGGEATRGCVPPHTIGPVGWIQCKWHHVFASDLLKSGCDVTAVSSTPLLFFSSVLFHPLLYNSCPFSLIFSFSSPWLSVSWIFFSLFFVYAESHTYTHRNGD